MKMQPTDHAMEYAEPGMEKSVKEYSCHQILFHCKTPWGDSDKWEKGKWYPCPMANNEDNGMPEDWPSHWDIFEIDPEAPAHDPMAIAPVFNNHTFNLIFALEICEKHNGEKFPRIES
jgi:hypothetical protein